MQITYPGALPTSIPTARAVSVHFVISSETKAVACSGVPVQIVDAPLEAVVLGAGRCIESYDLLKDLFMRS